MIPEPAKEMATSYHLTPVPPEPPIMGVTTDQAARDLVEPGFDIEKARAFFRACAAKGRVRPYSRKRGDTRNMGLYRGDMVVIAACARRMVEAGVPSDAVDAACELLRKWTKVVQDPPAPSPAIWVAHSVMHGITGFVLEVVTCRDRITGKPSFVVHVRHIDSEIGVTSGMPEGEPIPRSMWGCDLDDVVRAVVKTKDAN